jgi:hypothetical protein
MPSIIKVDQIQSDTGNVAFTGNIAFPAGSATLPSITAVGDTNTGIFFPAADTIAFTEGGVESGRFSSSGNFGLGTTNPPYQLSMSRPGATYIEIRNTGLGALAYYGISDIGAWIGTSTTHPTILYVGGGEQGRFDTAGNFQFNSGFGAVAIAYGCRAWVNFNGGPGTIRASGNVSSITDNGTGDYTVNFSNSMPDANYSVSGSMSWNTAGWGNVFTLDSILMTTAAVRVRSMSQDGNAFTLNDAFVGCVQIFR